MSGEGEGQGVDQGRGPQTHGASWPKGFKFFWLGFRFFGSTVW